MHSAHHRCEVPAALRGRYLQVRADHGARPAHLHPWRQVAHRGRQQDGLHRAALLQGQVQGDPEGDPWIHQEGCAKDQERREEEEKRRERMNR